MGSTELCFKNHDRPYSWNHSFVLICSAIANAKDSIGPRFRSVVILYLLSTLCAALVAVAGSFIFPTTMNLKLAEAAGNPPSGISMVLMQLVENAVSNPVASLVNANYIGILCWMFEAVADNGISIFYDYGKLLCLLVSCMLFAALVVNPRGYSRRYHFKRCDDISRLRNLGSGRGLTLADSHGLLLVQHRKQCRHAGGGHRIHSWSGAGFL